MSDVIFCQKCVYSNNIPNIVFDENGICNYCHQISTIKIEYGTGTKLGEEKLANLISKMKKKGKKKKYDCVVGISGGTDSSYLLKKCVEWGLRPLAVHYDNTWNSGRASQNISAITRQFKVDLITYVVDNKEIDAIKAAFIRAQVPEFDADTDLAFVQVLRSEAAKKGIKYILEGHSFLTEGISPIGNNYLDGGYIKDIVSKYSSVRIKTFPNMTFVQFIKWLLVYRQKFIRPLWYVHYEKQLAIDELERSTQWRRYRGHHLENRASSFAHQYWLPGKFSIDYRFLKTAADVREGRITREEGLFYLNQKIEYSHKDLEFVLDRLGMSFKEMEFYVQGPNRNWSEFKTYKKRFELLKPVFFLMMHLNFVPKTFYQKYCKKMVRQ